MRKIYKVEIKDRNKKIFYKNKVVRSPVTIEVSEGDLGLLKAEIRQQGVQNYKIHEVFPDNSKVKQKADEEEFVIAEDKTVIIEELTEKSPKTILEKLLQDGK